MMFIIRQSQTPRTGFMHNGLVFLLVFLLCSACSGSLAVAPTPLPATPEPYYRSDGGGDPRTSGYWLLWNSCAPENRAEMAAANGGREAGWFILDDLLEDPGISLGSLEIKTCSESINLLQGLDILGKDRADDPVYKLAAEVFTAELNLATGAESCSAIVEALLRAQLHLLDQNFDGTSPGINLRTQAEEINLARSLSETLLSYNLGNLCQADD